MRQGNLLMQVAASWITQDHPQCIFLPIQHMNEHTYTYAELEKLIAS